MNANTIEYYNLNAEKFVAGTIDADMHAIRDRFLKYVRDNGRILDAGCGSGRDTLAFLNEGFQVDAFDASEEICRIASKTTGIKVECKRFEDLDGEDQYDGIWASASLLHVDSADLPGVIGRLKKLLRQGGIIYASFKEGSGERIKDGRYFHDMTEQKCKELFSNAGFDMLEIFSNPDVREDHPDESWVNFIGRK